LQICNGGQRWPPLVYRMVIAGRQIIDVPAGRTRAARQDVHNRPAVIIKVIGSAAGGGFPQWNCNGPLSRAAWDRQTDVSSRTQASLAVSADGVHWVLINASPDIRQQILATPELQPRRWLAPRNSPIRAVVLTNADIDHIAGLLTLRERQSFTIFATEPVLATLAANSVFNVLDPAYVQRLALPLGALCPLRDHGVDLGLDIEAFAVPGKIALYLENCPGGMNLTHEGDTIGLKITDAVSHRGFYYLPACARLDPPLASRLRGAELVFFDGTLFSDDEMIQQGLSDKTGARMGHMSMQGTEGSLTAFEDLGVTRRIYIHINNSNPVLREGSSERRQVEKAGWEIAVDGMELRL
jgi:pyrroloquinoline quinone biosynthesis protein B